MPHTRKSHVSHCESCFTREGVISTHERVTAHTHDCEHRGATTTHCNTLQHTATHCNTLQHTATCSNTLPHTESHRIHTTVRARGCLQSATTHCNALQHAAPHCNTPQHTATREDADVRAACTHTHTHSHTHTYTQKHKDLSLYSFLGASLELPQTQYSTRGAHVQGGYYGTARNSGTQSHKSARSSI